MKKKNVWRRVQIVKLLVRQIFRRPYMSCLIFNYERCRYISLSNSVTCSSLKMKSTLHAHMKHKSFLGTYPGQTPCVTFAGIMIIYDKGIVRTPTNTRM
jgi:hypothetical protein